MLGEQDAELGEQEVLFWVIMPLNRGYLKYVFTKSVRMDYDIICSAYIIF